MHGEAGRHHDLDQSGAVAATDGLSERLSDATVNRWAWGLKHKTLISSSARRLAPCSCFHFHHRYFGSIEAVVFGHSSIDRSLFPTQVLGRKVELIKMLYWPERAAGSIVHAGLVDSRARQRHRCFLF
jgi:hypothetical protein